MRAPGPEQQQADEPGLLCGAWKCCGGLLAWCRPCITGHTFNLSWSTGHVRICPDIIGQVRSVNMKGTVIHIFTYP